MSFSSPKIPTPVTPPPPPTAASTLTAPKLPATPSLGGTYLTAAMPGSVNAKPRKSLLGQ